VVQANRSRNVRDASFQDLFDIQPDGTVGFGAIFFSPDERLTVTSAQAYVGGKFATGAVRHDIFAGVAHKRFKDRLNVGAYPEVSVGSVLDPIDPPPVDFGETPLQQTDRVKERSVFFSDLLTLTERWQVLAGLRYISYESRGVDADGLEVRGDTEKTYVPSVGLIFKPVPNMTTYLSYSRGLQEGEFAPFFANNAGQQTGAIRSKQYEAGAKLDVGGRLDFGLSLFEVERDAGYVNLTNDFVIDGRQRHRGVELVANGRIMDSLSLGVSLAYLNTRLLDVTEVAILGKRTEGTPTRQGAFSLEYRVPAVPGLFLSSSLTFASERPVDAQNTGFAPGYEVVDASIRYVTRLAARPVTVRLNIKNVFDEYYYSSAFFQGGLSVGRPREFILAIAADL
jgi:iron complex outermembrane receptor protein